MRMLIAIAALVAPVVAGAQRGTKDIVLEAHHMGPTVPLKIYGVAGSVRLVGWDRDSVVVTAPSRPLGFYFARDPAAMKTGMDQFRFGIEEARTDSTGKPFHFVVYLPKQSRISVKTVSADIDGTDVSGWFYSASGSIQLRGTSADLDVETINGSIDVNTNASVVRARTGRGRLIVRGARAGRRRVDGRRRARRRYAGHHARPIRVRVRRHPVCGDAGLGLHLRIL